MSPQERAETENRMRRGRAEMCQVLYVTHNGEGCGVGKLDTCTLDLYIKPLASDQINDGYIAPFRITFSPPIFFCNVTLLHLK